MFSWGHEEIEKLRTLAAQGLSARQMSLEFVGASRNAVISRMARSGIPFLNARGTRTSVAPLPVSIAEPEPEPMPKTEPIAEPSINPVSTLDLQRGQCKWPVTLDSPFYHCGAHAPHGPYCEPHKARAFSKSHRDPVAA